MNKAFAYYRVSTDNQKEEKTIELQKQKVADFANKNNYEIVEQFIDEGISGGLKDRPGLNILLDRLQQNDEIDFVIVYKLDRLARDLYIQEGLILEINKYKKQLISTLEPDLDGNDPFRKAFRQMLGIFSEFEKSMIALRLEGGRERKAKEGLWHGGNIYGYKNHNGLLKVDHIEAQAVSLIFRMRKGRKTYKQIAMELAISGFTPKRGRSWRISSIRKIYKNPIYKSGNIRYKGQIYKSETMPIIK